MPRADFYLIAKPRFLEKPLLLVCELARKANDSGQPLLVLAASAAQAEVLDELLWEFDPDAYVPHQIAGTDEDDDITPVLIVPPEYQAPMRPLVLNLRNEPAPAGFEPASAFSTPRPVPCFNCRSSTSTSHSVLLSAATAPCSVSAWPTTSMRPGVESDSVRRSRMIGESSTRNTCKGCCAPWLMRIPL